MNVMMRTIWIKKITMKKKKFTLKNLTAQMKMKSKMSLMSPIHLAFQLMRRAISKPQMMVRSAINKPQMMVMKFKSLKKMVKKILIIKTIDYLFNQFISEEPRPDFIVGPESH